VSDYTTTAKVKARLGITDHDDDTALGNVITASSRWIDRYCNRRFYASSETRYYTAVDWQTVFVDDLLSITTLKTDDDADRTYSATWTTTDYDLMPFNVALAEAQPYTWIQVAPEGDYTFPKVAKGVEIVGSFGHNATASHPLEIEEACNLLAMRLWKRKDAIFGVAGPQAMGVQLIQAKIEQDRDVLTLLDPYRRLFP